MASTFELDTRLEHPHAYPVLLGSVQPQVETVSNNDGNFLSLLWIQLKAQIFQWEIERASILRGQQMCTAIRHQWKFDTVKLNF